MKYVFQRVVVRRIDIAFDGVPFTVQDVYSALVKDAVRSDFKRDTLRYIENPRQLRENGVLGCASVYIGSRTSTRYMRVYDKHGETRLEIEYKDAKSIQVAETILEKNQDDALKAAVGHMRDYIDFLTDWWDKFVKEYERLYAKLPASVREIELKRVTGWLIKQVSSALSVGYEAHGEEFIRSMIEFGRHKREDNPRYRSVLSLLSSGRKPTR